MDAAESSVLLTHAAGDEHCIDFASSTVGWVTATGSEARFAVESVLTEATVHRRSYLGSCVVACDVYGAGVLPHTPLYLFYWSAGADAGTFYRFCEDGRRLHSGAGADTVARVVVREARRPVRRLLDFPAIIEAYDACASLVARLTSDGAIHEFPVKHINVHRSSLSFQVETGPVLTPAAAGATPAFIAFNRFDSYQFVLDFPAHGGAVGRREGAVELFAYE